MTPPSCHDAFENATSRAGPGAKTRIGPSRALDGTHDRADGIDSKQVTGRRCLDVAKAVRRAWNSDAKVQHGSWAKPEIAPSGALHAAHGLAADPELNQYSGERCSDAAKAARHVWIQSDEPKAGSQYEN